MLKGERASLLVAAGVAVNTDPHRYMSQQGQGGGPTDGNGNSKSVARGGVDRLRSPGLSALSSTSKRGVLVVRRGTESFAVCTPIRFGSIARVCKFTVGRHCF
jgi:hypothetical protein